MAQSLSVPMDHPRTAALERPGAWRLHWVAVLIAAVTIGTGVFLRLYPVAAFSGTGFDEHLYSQYVTGTSKIGLLNYPALSDYYIERQRELPGAILPPTRFLYIFCGYIWHTISGESPLDSLHRVSALFTILTLFCAAAFGYRVGGYAVMLGLSALVAVAPMQLHMSQHALIDGVYAFWVTLIVWSLWECLQKPDNRWWLSLYAFALAALMLTKENAPFAYAGVGAALAAAHFFHCGKITRKLVIATAVGPLCGVAILVQLAGGLENLVEIYRLLVMKAYNLPYAIKTGDGPWYRYLVDLMVVSPVVLILVIGSIFSLQQSQKLSLFLIAFLAGSFLVMANVKYGMNLRYANMWDVPLRFLALWQLGLLSARFGRWRNVALVLGTAAVCAHELHQYVVFEVRYPLYELVTEALLSATKILK